MPISWWLISSLVTKIEVLAPPTKFFKLHFQMCVVIQQDDQGPLVDMNSVSRPVCTTGDHGESLG